MTRMVRRCRALKKLELTPRDYEILGRAGKQRFVTTEDIKDLWTDPSTHNHYTRLRRLAAVGLLGALLGDAGTKLGYRITRKGIHHLPSEEMKAKALGIRRVGYRTGYTHDKLLSQVQRIFEKSSMVSGYLSEPEVRSLLQSRHGRNERRGDGYKVPDGLFMLKTAKGSYRVALELELSVKGIAVYRRIFRELLLQPDFDFVFYLTASEQLSKTLVQILKEVRATDLVVQTAYHRNGIYFATLPCFLERGLATSFEGEGSTFSLETLTPPQG